MKVAILVLALALAGCGSVPMPFAKPADTISISRMGAAKMLADIGEAQVVITTKAAGYCKAGKIAEADCQDGIRLLDRLEQAKAKAWAALLTPSTEVDWQAVMDAVKFVVALAGKAL